jgi:general secretion pathway protein H
VKNRGFSLVEMIVVLVVISLSVALVTPSLSRFSRTIELTSAAKKISAILRYSRSEAVNQGQIYQIVFDSDLREVRVQRMESIEVKEESEKREEKAFKKTYPLPSGINMREMKISSPQYPSELPTIEFYPNGGSNGGSILLKSEDRGGYRIKIHFVTGMVKVEKV